MKLRTILICGLLVATSTTSALAGSSKKLGTAGAQELLLPIGSRGTAMGGAVVANPLGLESIFWNPAGLATLDGTEALFSHQQYIADVDLNFGALATTIEDFGTIGISAKVVSVGDIEETTEDFSDGTGSIYNPTFTVVGLTYARSLTASVMFGGTAMFINESVFEVSARGVAFDFGVTYTPQWHGVTLGLTIKNYGPNMRFQGPGFESAPGQSRTNAAFELPSSINIGLGYNFLNQGLSSMTLAGNFRSNNFQEDFWQGGLEYGYNERYFLRAGYNYSTQEEYLYDFSAGAGLALPFGESLLGLEYAWSPTPEFFEDKHYFTLRLNF